MRYEEAASQRALQSMAERRSVRRKAAANPTKPWRAEPDPTRLAAFEHRLRVAGGRPGAEVEIGPTTDYQPVAFLTEGARVSHAVAMVKVKVPRGMQTGSGFMISPDLFITNHHVIESIEQARNATIEFNFELDPSRRSVPTTTFALDPDRCFVTVDEDDLDFTVVAVGKRLEGDTELAAIGYCALSEAVDKHALGMAVNIIEHPEARPKCVVIRNNLLTHRTPRTLLYDADTARGASGSPVFNDAWDVIALHHWGEPHLDVAQPDGVSPEQPCNEGVRVSCIVERLRQERSSVGFAARYPGALALVDTALALGNSSVPEKRPVIEPGSTPGVREAALTRGAPADGALHATIPLEITMRIGVAQLDGAAIALDDAAAHTAPSRPPPSTPAVPGVVPPRRAPVVGSPAAEKKLVIDPDYAHRTGYNPRFLGSFIVPLPVADPDLIAPLLTRSRAAGELKYEHFSLVMHARRRMALFTATNVDGQAYIEIDRKTGQPAQESGDTWFPDPRIDPKYVIGTTFYAEWSHYFDRGHLTRRSDPTWGDDDSAVRANADTFHLPNCTPQHFRFNESAKFWQGVERYILEHGGMQRHKRLCVLQGPVLLGEVATCDDVEVPLEFWKIVAWVGKTGPKVAGFIVSQRNLLDQARSRIAQATDTTPINVEQWRATIAEIAEQTGLDFGKLGKYDTYKHPGPVGEGIELITNLEQLTLA